MSRLGKGLLLLAGFCIVVAGMARTILGGWHDTLYIPVGLFLVCLVVGLVRDIAFYKEFFTMRTTKHGMNMGALILLTLVLVAVINFVAVRHNHKWDFTEEGLNSLSDQSVKVLQQLDDTLQVSLFYRGGNESAEQEKARFKEVVVLYQDIGHHFKVREVDVIKRPGLAQEYGVDKGSATVFVEYKGKRNRVDDLTEEGLTTAMLKVMRKESKTVYFLTGHGERDANSTEAEGAADFKKSLEDSGYTVQSLDLITRSMSMPTDADMVLVIGPKTALLDPELEVLRKYTREGGHLFIAADPGERHNLALLTKSFGIEFKNEYVLDQFGQILGASAAMALGREYGSTEITKNFAHNMMTMFHLASAVQKEPGLAAGITVQEIIKTGNTSFATNSIEGEKVKVDPSRRGPHTLGMVAKGKTALGEGKKPEDAKEYSVVVYGDSDFLTNQLLAQQLNRDLAINSVAYQLKENNMISIRPKQPKGTTLTLTRTQALMLVFGFFLPIPILLFGFGGFVWYRRRSA